MNLPPHPVSLRGGLVKPLLFGLLFLVAALVVVWVAFLPMIVKSQITRLSGFPVEADSIKVNPFGGTVYIKDFELRNPAEFASPEFVQVRLLDVEARPFSLFSNTIEMPRLRLDLEKVVLVTNADGTMNAKLFSERLDQALGESSSETPAFRIGELTLRLGRVEMLDYSKGAEPKRTSINLGVDRRFTDVTDPKVIIAPLMADIIKANAAAISGLVPADYQQTVNSLLQGIPATSDPAKVLGEDGARTIDEAKKLFDSLKGRSKP